MANTHKKKMTYRALTGLDYKEEGAKEYTRVEAGDKVERMAENDAKHELAANNIEEWVDRQTENVKRDEDVETEFYQVRSRHSGDDVVVKEGEE